MTPPHHPAEDTEDTEDTEDKRHADSQRRFIQIEQKLDRNTEVTESLALDTAELVDMWKDAGVVFKWMRRAGAAVLWLGKVGAVIGGAWAAFRYGVPK